MTRGPTASLLSGNVEYFDEIDTLLMIEADVTKNEQNIGKLKDHSAFLFNDIESMFDNKPIEIYIEKCKYKQAFS